MGEQQKQFILSMLAYAVQRGISAEQLCLLSNLDLTELTKKSMTGISQKQVNDLWKNASHLCNDPLFGLHFGESLQLGALGAVGEIIKSSNTVGEAITIAASLTYLVTDLFKMEIQRSNNSFTIRFIPTGAIEDESVRRHVADLLMVFSIHELNGLMLERISPTGVTYPYKLSNLKEYQRVLRCAAIKTKADYSVEFRNTYWDIPILTANYEVQKMFLEKISSEKANPFSNPITFQVKILDYLMKNAYLGILSLEDVAANFNITPRSLQRRLQDEGVTFQQLADSVRKSLAIHFIESGKYQIKEISNMLGYNELSAFSRAFKRWTGKTPMTYDA
jgi:AraC-like DNA-binding protein